MLITPKKVIYLFCFSASCAATANASIPIDTLIQQCANQTPLPVAHAIIKTESAYKPYALGVNLRGKSAGGIKQPTNYNDAVVMAKALIANGNNIDLGLAQINSANLKRLNISIEQVLEPCNNLKAMQYILSSCFSTAGDNGYGERIQRAFSCYNTGNHRNGFSNGYVNKTTKNMNAYLAAKDNTRYNDVVNKSLPNSSIELAKYANQINQVNLVQSVTHNRVEENNASLVGEIGLATKDDSRLDVFSSKSKTGVF